MDERQKTVWVSSPHLKVYVTLLFLLVPTGCTGPFSKISDHSVENVQSIGVVSLIGETLAASYVGVIAFGNDHWESEELGWNLNAMSAAAVETYLTNRGFVVVSVPYDRKAMWAKYLESRESYGARVAQAYGFEPAVSDMESEIAEMSRSGDFDALIMLVPGHLGRYCQGGAPCNYYGDRGYGTFNRLERSNHAYISIMVHLFSTQDLKIMTNFRANLHVPLSFTRWEESLDGFSEQERSEIRAAFQKLASDELVAAVGKLGL